jgi:hypothetical protein
MTAAVKQYSSAQADSDMDEPLDDLSAQVGKLYLCKFKTTAPTGHSNIHGGDRVLLVRLTFLTKLHIYEFVMLCSNGKTTKFISDATWFNRNFLKLTP